MPLFKKKNNVLTLINAIQPAKEKDLQRLIEENLKDVLDMHFLASEYRTASGRIDTLAVDSDGAPVIFAAQRFNSFEFAVKPSTRTGLDFFVR